MDLSISGLASGLDWKTLVSQLADASRASEKTLQLEQNTLSQQGNAYSSIQTQLMTLSNRLTALKDPLLFQSRQANVSDKTIGTAVATAGTSAGSYKFHITKMASASVQSGKNDVGSSLSSTDQVSDVNLATGGFSTTISAGIFTINGQQISLERTDSLQDIFDRVVSATSGEVTASYDPVEDKISFNSASEIVLGSSTDTSNFLQALKLSNNGTSTVTSSAKVGAINQSVSLDRANFATGIVDDGNGEGEFKINGVSIKYNAAGDNLSSLLTRINNSSAGVIAGYDSVNDRLVLTSKSTGDMGISLQDVSGNFLTASGLIEGTLQRGSNLSYTINGGPQLSSLSNTITGDSSGLQGLSVTALAEGDITVTVLTDTEALKQAITDFVDEFNYAQSVIDANTSSSTDSTGKVTAGVLAGTGDADEIGSSLRRLAYARLSESTAVFKSLDDLGIATTGNNNNLVVDDAKLTAALQSDPAAIQDLFGNAATGLAVTLDAYIQGLIGDDGSLVNKQSTISKQVSAIDTQIANIERQIAVDSEAMTAAFVAMESAQAAAKQQLQYLEQTFGGNSSSSSSNKK